MNELYHHGVKGMHWGVRRYQNPDGTLKTPKGVSKTTKGVIKDYNNMTNAAFKTKYQVSKRRYARRVNKYEDPYIHRLNKDLNKATRQLKRHNETAKEYKREYNDLKYNGVKSGTYKDHMHSVNAKRERKYNEQFGTNTYESSLTKIGNDFIDSISSDQTIKQLMDDRNKKYKYYKNEGRKYADRIARINRQIQEG